jgi:hypothetical protein
MLKSDLNKFFLRNVSFHSIGNETKLANETVLAHKGLKALLIEIWIDIDKLFIQADDLSFKKDFTTNLVSMSLYGFAHRSLDGGQGVEYHPHG